MQALVQIIGKLSLCFHLYADNIQLYDASTIERLRSLITPAPGIITDVKLWVNI